MGKIKIGCASVIEIKTAFYFVLLSAFTIFATKNNRKDQTQWVY